MHDNVSKGRSHTPHAKSGIPMASRSSGNENTAHMVLVKST